MKAITIALAAATMAAFATTTTTSAAAPDGDRARAQGSDISRQMGSSSSLRQPGRVRPSTTKRRPRLVRRCYKTYPGVAKKVHQSSTSRYWTVIVPGTVCRWEWL